MIPALINIKARSLIRGAKCDIITVVFILRKNNEFIYKKYPLRDKYETEVSIQPIML